MRATYTPSCKLDFFLCAALLFFRRNLERTERGSKLVCEYAVKPDVRRYIRPVGATRFLTMVETRKDSGLLSVSVTGEGSETGWQPAGRFIY